MMSHEKTQPPTSGLMRLDKHRVLLDGRHALIEHRGVELPVVAHSVEDFQGGGYARSLHAFIDRDRIVAQPFATPHMHKSRRKAAGRRAKPCHRGRLAISITKIGNRKEIQKSSTTHQDI